MHPALSIIFFTVTAGMGYGLAILVCIHQAFGLSESFTALQFMLVMGIALALATVGLLASTLHLANPKNAWRALSQFKRSWLAREAVLALAFYPLALVTTSMVWSDESSLLSLILLLATAALALLTVYSTGMIYACLKTVRQWYTPITPLGFCSLAVLSGAAALNMIAESMNKTSYWLYGVLLFCVVAAFACKLAIWLCFKSTTGSLSSATGLAKPNIRLLDIGHSAPNFLTREFGYRLSAKKRYCLRALMLALIIITPLVFLYADLVASNAAYLMAACYLGVLIERWLFFAEAEHVVRLYHGM